MKAKIDGIEVEGTPQEIHELMIKMGPVKLQVTGEESNGIKYGYKTPAHDWLYPGGFGDFVKHPWLTTITCNTADEVRFLIETKPFTPKDETKEYTIRPLDTTND